MRFSVLSSSKWVLDGLCRYLGTWKNVQTKRYRYLHFERKNRWLYYSSSVARENTSIFFANMLASFLFSQQQTESKKVGFYALSIINFSMRIRWSHLWRTGIFLSAATSDGFSDNRSSGKMWYRHHLLSLEQYRVQIKKRRSGSKLFWYSET